MRWPITIAQCKVAVDILCLIFNDTIRRQYYDDLGWMDPNTGPWPRYGFWWRWGYSNEPSPQPSPLPQDEAQIIGYE